MTRFVTVENLQASIEQVRVSLAMETNPALAKLKVRFGKVVYTTGHSTHGVRLFQSRRKHGAFTVLYFLEYHTECTYAEAAKYLGQAIMHMQACNGLLDNEVA